mgnify:CR=1 FL=1
MEASSILFRPFPIPRGCSIFSQPRLWNIRPSTSAAVTPPHKLGDILQVKATVRHVGNTSMLVGVRVEAENPTTGEVRHTASCYMTFVALDRNNKPTIVPGVIAETDKEKEKMARAKRVADIIRQSRDAPKTA